MADRVPRIAFAFSAQMLAAHVFIHPLQQIVRATGGDAEFIAATQIRHVEVAHTVLAAHLCRHRRARAASSSAMRRMMPTSATSQASQAVSMAPTLAQDMRARRFTEASARFTPRTSPVG